ncbi:GGDEF domain-containing protein [Devosia sp. 2618]|uniref:GGDEF domain-containing protein n=1 Tax=Devosia sp. 2618 TaxID=3156454 RepID=UPI0033993FCF
MPDRDSEVSSSEEFTPTLTFNRETEVEFRAAVLRDQRQATLVCAVGAFIIWVGFATLDMFRIWYLPPGDWAWQVALLLIGRAVVMAALIGTIFEVWLGRQRYDRLVVVVFVLVGLVASLTANLARSMGAFAVDSAQVAVVMAAFLPIGLRFKQSLTVGLIVTCACVWITLQVLPHSMIQDSAQLILTIIVAFLLAATGGYLREAADRKQFLLRRELAEQASIDILTGLPNRRVFQWHVESALRQCVREKKSAVLAIIDVDNFKQYNDHYGHVEGDAALRKVAQSLRATARRPLDITARVGGEEFCVFLFDTDLARCQAALEQLLVRVRQLSIQHRDSATGVVTISAGATNFDGAEDLAGLYRRADAALYQSKTAGRNQLSFS